MNKKGIVLVFFCVGLSLYIILSVKYEPIVTKRGNPFSGPPPIVCYESVKITKYGKARILLGVEAHNVLILRYPFFLLNIFRQY